MTAREFLKALHLIRLQSWYDRGRYLEDVRRLKDRFRRSDR